MIRRGEIHYIDGLRAGPVLVISGDQLNARVDERPWVLGMYPAPPDTPDPLDVLVVRTTADDPVAGFIGVHDVRRPIRRSYRPTDHPDRISAATLARIELALLGILEITPRL